MIYLAIMISSMIMVIPFTLLVSSMIILGGMYVSIYERAPTWERVQVLGVGIGIAVGALLTVMYPL